MGVMQEYYSIMVQYQDNVSRKHMPSDVAELLFTNPIKMIHTACTKALKGGNIQADDHMKSKNIIENVLGSIDKIQSEFSK